MGAESIYPISNANKLVGEIKTNTLPARGITYKL